MLLNIRSARQQLKTKKKIKDYVKKIVKNPNSQTDQPEEKDIDTNRFLENVNNEQIKKDNNLTGWSEDASESYISVVVDPGY